VLACNTGTCLKEKVQLRNNLESANAKIKDLEAKIELLVCEKKSLTTAIRIIQEDNSQQNNNNCIEKQESPWVKVGVKQLKKKKKKSKHREAKKSPQHTAAESEENLSQISEETQTVQSNDVLNDQTRDKQKKDDPVGTKTYKSTTSTVSVVGESMIKHING
jgi:chromosome segregation ATPase